MPSSATLPRTTSLLGSTTTPRISASCGCALACAHGHGRGHRRSQIWPIRRLEQGAGTEGQGVLALPLRLRHREGGLRTAPSPRSHRVVWMLQPRVGNGDPGRKQLQGRRDHVLHRPRPRKGHEGLGINAPMRRLSRAGGRLVAKTQRGQDAIRPCRSIHAGILARSVGLRPSMQAVPLGVRP